MKSTCIVIPCYNESPRLHIEAFSGFDAFDILFVNDGSQDDTLNLISSLSQENPSISFLHLAHNQGKAAAIRQGMISLQDRYEIVGYLDADLSTSLQEMQRLIEIYQTNAFKMVMGSRLKIAGAQIKRYWWRHYSGRLIASIIDGLLLKSGIYDTQCGAKVIDGKTSQLLFKEPFETKWLFDVELLLRLKKVCDPTAFKNAIVEIPLNKWVDDGNSRISFIDLLQLPFSFLKIYKRYL